MIREPTYKGTIGLEWLLAANMMDFGIHLRGPGTL